MMPSRNQLGQTFGAFAVLAAGLFGSSVAQAHFYLQEPASATMQSTQGDPQKTAPCGTNTGVATNQVTTYTQGQMITLTINETITHPGHYRVAIADSAAKLPADPPVTVGSTECGSTPINPNPTLPLVADGLFVHTAAFSGPQTVKIQLPQNLTCTNCTMQITEFMSNHTAPCFYYHCATISIVPPTAPTDAGTPADMSSPPADAATTEPPTMSTGCSYYLGAAAAPAGLLLATPFVFGLLLRRRRRAA